jgi:hypothetical protein
MSAPVPPVPPGLALREQVPQAMREGRVLREEVVA